MASRCALSNGIDVGSPANLLGTKGEAAGLGGKRDQKGKWSLGGDHGGEKASVHGIPRLLDRTREDTLPEPGHPVSWPEPCDLCAT